MGKSALPLHEIKEQIMQGRNTLVIVMMCSSMGLLLLLQFFWLKGAYENAAEDFRKETNALFRNTIFTMHDSLIQRSMVPIEGDTLLPRLMTTRKFGSPNGKVIVRESLHDSIDSFIKVTEKTASIQIYSSNNGDSISRILRPLVARMQKDKQPKNFVFRFAADSLNKDSIDANFSRALKQAGIDIGFKVVSFEAPRRRHEKSEARPFGRFVSDVVPFSPITQYAVTFNETPRLLWKEITPQILFGLFLTTLTAVSFIALYKNLRSQQRLMAIKNDFISNVTHELKTPVATVSVALEALKNFNALHDPKKTEEYLDIAQRELNRLTLMTDKILKTLVYEDQGVSVKNETIQVDLMIDEILSSMKLVFDKKQTQLSFEKSGLDFTIHGSVEHLTNVVYNLIDNALKYGGEESRLKIELESLPGELILKVRDFGIGIAEEYQKKIFEKFFRVPSGDVHNIKGYGLGLSYVASVVESHGGEITVESKHGEGSCFVVKLPRYN